jgi:hypothetical protein
MIQQVVIRNLSEWIINFCLEAEMIVFCRESLQNDTKNFKEMWIFRWSVFSAWVGPGKIERPSPKSRPPERLVVPHSERKLWKERSEEIHSSFLSLSLSLPPSKSWVKELNYLVSFSYSVSVTPCLSSNRCFVNVIELNWISGIIIITPVWKAPGMLKLLQDFWVTRSSGYLRIIECWVSDLLASFHSVLSNPKYF